MKKLTNFMSESLEQELDESYFNESYNTTLYADIYDEVDEDKKDNDDKKEKEEAEQQEKAEDAAENVLDKFNAILQNKTINPVERAKLADELLRKNLKFDKNWNIKAVKDPGDNVFIALRHTKKSNRPFGLSQDITSSTMGFLDDINKIYVYDADNADRWSDEHHKLVCDILNLLNAKLDPDDENGYHYLINAGNSITDNVVPPFSSEGQNFDNIQ